MEKPLQNIIKACFEEHVKRMEKLTDLNEIIRKVDRERKPIHDKTPSLADLGGRDGFTETLLRKMEENEDEAEETLSSAAKGKADGGMTKRSSEKTSTHGKGSEREDEFGEALEEVMKEFEKNCRERRRAIPDKPSSSQNKGLKMAGGKLSALGMGGIGETTIHNDGATINFTFGTIQMTNHHYHEQKMDEDDDADEQ